MRGDLLSVLTREILSSVIRALFVERPSKYILVTRFIDLFAPLSLARETG
ncbi:hypothetical protein ACPOL_6310 [Acidisarcina polymorpha]|uniref:Uncharacterized protein n=1 Tax=Acidisarcina polymorpha TaxID=2211140 RepID=A0A2Z5GAC5_9BACT|nr:hypothetical protein ACPOL_6310 [Acidisarcina polymorpha]